MKRKLVRSIIGIGLLAAGMGPVASNPTGGVVTFGGAGITTAPGIVTINQTTHTTIIDWQTFSIGAGELTKFVQPDSSAAALNRVLGGGISTIAGTLSANGQVVILNGNGIVITSTGAVNTNGFIASTRDVTDSDYLTSNWRFTGSGTAGVTNLGTVTCSTGNVYLIGKTVDNEGTINAPNGTAGLAAGDNVLLTQGGVRNVFVSPSPTATSAAGLTAVHNAGSINSATAELAAANGNLYALAINNEGAVRATQVSAGGGGRIFLTADSGQIQNNGSIVAHCGTPTAVTGGTVRIAAGSGSVWNRKTIDASGTYGGKVGITAQNVQNDGLITVAGTKQTGGLVSVVYSGNAIGSVTGKIDASGQQTGGTIEILGLGANSEAYLSVTLDVDAKLGGAGSIYINGPTLYLTDATLTANGVYGGTISIGAGDPLAATAPRAATTLYISPGTTLEANGHFSDGYGGTITAIGTGTTVFQGFAEANSGSHAAPGTISITGVTATTSGTKTFAGTRTLVVGGSGGGPSGTGTTKTSAVSFEFIDPNPGANNAFGRPFTGLFNLTSNTTLVTSPGDSFGGAGAGAAYLFNDTTGALLSTLRGSDAGDGVGTSVQIFGSGNTFAILTPGWSGGAGAVSFGNGAHGFVGGGGSLSAANSLVGGVAGDHVGSGGLYPLVNGNYLVLSPNWNQSAGAVTWVDPRAGVAGAITSSNSLVGATAGDGVGAGGIVQLSNGVNYLVLSPNFEGGAGAITNCSNGSGRGDVVSTFNSLVGASSSDHVGTASSIIDSGEGFYLVDTSDWGGGAGAVTWNASNVGTTGVVSTDNSLVGSSSTDAVGSGGIAVLPIDGYVVDSPGWNGGTGAATFAHGSAGVTGVVNAGNSLVGSQDTDHVGSGGVTVLGDGNYAVLSPDWNGTAGAVTVASRGFGVSGAISASNSFVGTSTGDRIGSGGVVTVDQISSVILSPDFANGSGAVTEISGDFPPFSAPSGVVSSGNSLVGAVAGDHVGSGGIFNLDNGYLVLSPDWSGGRGAITSSSTSLTGVVSASNSLVGASTSDHVGTPGTVTSLFDYFLVIDPAYNNGAGAVTFGSERSQTVGVISSSNSLVGANAGDAVGSGGVTQLPNSNYVVLSPNWNDGAGAVTLGTYDGGISGTVSAANSLTGSAGGDHVGSGGIVSVGGSLGFSDQFNYVVLSPDWDSGRGAVTELPAGSGDGFDVNTSTSSFTGGEVSTANSLVGAAEGDAVGSAGSVTNYGSYYLVTTANFNGEAGAVTWSSVANPTVGVLSSANSLVGASAGDHLGSGGVQQVFNGNYLVLSPDFDHDAGAISLGSGTAGITGVVSASNSLVGAQSGDAVGSGGIGQVTDNNYLILSPDWGNGAGAVTNFNTATGLTGVVSAANSLVGASAGDGVGSAGSVAFSDSNYYLVVTPGYNGGAGAVTWNANTGGTVGTVSAANSLVGSAAGDNVGSGGVQLLGNTYVVLSPNWNGGAGAVTQGAPHGGVSGTVGSSNSLVGSAAGDSVGSGGLQTLDHGDAYLVLSPLWNSGAGAVTYVNANTGRTGFVGAGNSLVGAAAGDGVGSGGITVLGLTGNYLVLSPNFDNARGAVTLGTATAGVSGLVSASNSVVGASAGDYAGSGGVVELTNGDYVVLSPLFNNSAGAVTWGNGVSGVRGVITTANSITGGVEDAGEQYAGESADGLTYFVSFTTDTSRGGDGRVLAGSVNGPTAVPASKSLAGLFQQPQVLTVEASNFNFLVGALDYYISDPETPGHDSANVDGTGAVNDGEGRDLAAGSSTAKMSGPQRLLVPGSGIWNIFGGTVYATPPPAFVSQQLTLNLSPQVFSHLNEMLFGHP